MAEYKNFEPSKIGNGYTLFDDTNMKCKLHFYKTNSNQAISPFVLDAPYSDGVLKYPNKESIETGFKGADNVFGKINIRCKINMGTFDFGTGANCHGLAYSIENSFSLYSVNLGYDFETAIKRKTLTNYMMKPSANDPSGPYNNPCNFLVTRKPASWWDNKPKIRWFDEYTFKKENLEGIKAIIPGYLTLVYNRKKAYNPKSEKEQIVDLYDGKLIKAYGKEGKDPTHHFNPMITDIGINSRTALGVTMSGNYILLVARDKGEVNGIKSGISVEKTAEIMYQAGCEYAILLDGSDSSQMITYDYDSTTQNMKQTLRVKTSRPIGSILVVHDIQSEVS